LAGTVIGVLLLVVLLRSVNLSQLGSDFSTVDYRYLGLAVLPFVLNLLLKVPRWALLFGDDAPSWNTLFGAINVGYAVNSLLPLRLGEVVRAYWIRDRAHISMVRTLSTIALERVTDGVTLLIVFLLMVPTVAVPARLVGPALLVGALFIAALLVMIWLAHALSSRRDSHAAVVLRRIETGKWSVLGRALNQVVMGLQALRSRRRVALLVMYTVLIWATNSLLIWFVLLAFHIDAPPTAGILLTAVLNLGMSVPSSPGYLGVFDFLMVLTLGLYGVHRTQALAAALALHAIAFVPVTIIGLVYIVRSGLQVTLEMLRKSPSPL
jgi:uncharacterized protein (TIRG00374 family)